jgi:hypothetical protein
VIGILVCEGLDSGVTGFYPRLISRRAAFDFEFDRLRLFPHGEQRENGEDKRFHD